MATIGRTSGTGTVIKGASSAIAFRLRSFRFQAASSFTALSMYNYHYPTGTSPSGYANPCVMGIYSDSGGAPDTLLGQTGTKAMTSGGAWLYGDGWQGINLQSGVSIVSGTWYWLAVIGSPVLAASSGGSDELMTLGSYSSTLPTTYTPSFNLNDDGNIYASSEAISGSSSNLMDVALSDSIVWEAAAGDAVVWEAAAGDAVVWDAAASDAAVWACTVSDAAVWDVSLSDTSRT